MTTNTKAAGKNTKSTGKKNEGKEVITPVAKQPEIKDNVQPEGKAETIVAAPAAVAPVGPIVVQSKAQKANAVFARMFGMETVPARKDMINAAIAEAGLTPAGAATYLQNYKAKNGLVNRTPAAA